MINIKYIYLIKSLFKNLFKNREKKFGNILNVLRDSKYQLYIMKNYKLNLCNRRDETAILISQLSNIRQK